MNRCPITCRECGSSLYSAEGLKLISPVLRELKPLPFTSEELRLEAFSRSGEFSLTGSSLKVLAKINNSAESFELSPKGKFILKPQNILYPEIPENEDLTMKMAESCGIEVPVHGLTYNSDKSLTYFVNRFDRGAGKIKFPVENFAQLSGKTSDRKYDSSMEEITALIDKYSTFPVLDKIKLLRVVIFNYLSGNNRAHLKKFSLIKKDGVVSLGPFYALLNSAITDSGNDSEMALALNGKKNLFNKNDFIYYFAGSVLGLNSKTILNILNKFESSVSGWFELIQISFLSRKMKEKYFVILEKRIKQFLK